MNENTFKSLMIQYYKRIKVVQNGAGELYAIETTENMPPYMRAGIFNTTIYKVYFLKSNTLN